MNMTITEAQKLLDKYVTGSTLRRHCLTVSAVMGYWAEQEGEDSEFWQVTGLLHDLDFEKYPEQHCVKVKEILESERDSFPAISDDLIHAIQSHGWKLCCDVEPVTRMEKVLYTIDELTGLIFACAMARPSKSVMDMELKSVTSKSVMDMELKSVTKKFKTPAFAAGCNRDVIKEGSQMLGMELNDVILRCLEGMRSRHEELGV